MFSLSFPVMVNEGELMIHSSCISIICVFHPRVGQAQITNLLPLCLLFYSPQGAPSTTIYYERLPVCTIFKLQIEKLPGSSQWVVALLARPPLPFQKVNVSLQTTPPEECNKGAQTLTSGPLRAQPLRAIKQACDEMDSTEKYKGPPAHLPLK